MKDNLLEVLCSGGWGPGATIHFFFLFFFTQLQLCLKALWYKKSWMFWRQILGLVAEFLPPTVRALSTPEGAPVVTASYPKSGAVCKLSLTKSDMFRKLNSGTSNFLTIAMRCCAWLLSCCAVTNLLICKSHHSIQYVHLQCWMPFRAIIHCTKQ